MLLQNITNWLKPLTSYWQEIVGWYFLLARSVQRPNSAQYPIWDGRVLRGVSHAPAPNTRGSSSALPIFEKNPMYVEIVESTATKFGVVTQVENYVFLGFATSPTQRLSDWTFDAISSWSTPKICWRYVRSKRNETMICFWILHLLLACWQVANFASFLSVYTLGLTWNFSSVIYSGRTNSLLSMSDPVDFSLFCCIISSCSLF